MGIVFINYRREQTAGEARALYNDLVKLLGADRVFMDVDNIALGRDFREVLRERLADCEVMLALIGRGWADAADAEGRRRLDQAGDFVRLEIATALARNVAVTPVLLQDTHMPQADQLPDDLKAMAFRNGFSISHATWESNVNEMVRRLGLAPAAAPRAARSKTPLLVGVGVAVGMAAVAAWFVSRPGPEPASAAGAAPAASSVAEPASTTAAVAPVASASTPGIVAPVASAPAAVVAAPTQTAPAAAQENSAASLIAALTSPDQAARQSAAVHLQASFLRSSEAVGLGVVLLEPNRFFSLAGAAPRSQLLTYLLATDDSAWTPALRQRAAAAIRGLRERQASGKVSYRPEMAARIEDLGKRVGA